MKKRNMTERRFKCSGCGSIQTAYKSSAIRTASGHIKTMYCIYCKQNKDFIQIKYNKTLSGDLI